MLHEVARGAYKRMSPDRGDLENCDDDALIAILFSAAALEAFIGELALSSKSYSGLAPALARAGEVLEHAEEGHMSVIGQYLILKSLLPAVAFAKGERLFEDFCFLIKLRNAIVHLKPAVVGKEPQKLIKAMQSRNLCGEHSAPMTSWIMHVATRAAARWACNVAADMSRAVFPNGLERPEEGVVVTQYAGEHDFLSNMGHGFDRVV